MNQGPNQPQNPGGGGGGRRRRRRRGAGKKHQQHGGGQPQQHAKQPGQGGQGGGGNRRGRSRRQQSFVGPMDHSYRNGNANGNVADGNAQGARFRGGHHQVQPKFIPNDMTPVVGREDAPARIFCFIEDLFFLAKINEVSKKLNLKVEFVKTPEPILERASDEVPEEDRPTLVIFDLNNLNAKPLQTIPKLRSKLKKGTSIIGFVSHIQGDLKLKALEAGCDSVMPRSAFSQNLPNLLRRHGAPEEVNDGTDQQQYIQ